MLQPSPNDPFCRTKVLSTCVIRSCTDNSPVQNNTLTSGIVPEVSVGAKPGTRMATKVSALVVVPRFSGPEYVWILAYSVLWRCSALHCTLKDRWPARESTWFPPGAESEGVCNPQGCIGPSCHTFWRDGGTGASPSQVSILPAPSCDLWNHTVCSVATHSFRTCMHACT